MLIAWARGKRRSRNEYEDEIVSAVFGPLRYLDEDLRGRIFRSMLKAAFSNADISSDAKCRLEFWPNLADEWILEPDIIVELTHPDPLGNHLLLIEAKWNSPPSKDQLVRQWRAAETKYPTHRLWHVFLTKRPQSRYDMVGNHEDPKNLASLTWSRFASIVQSIAKEDAGPAELKCWADDVCKFLRRLQCVPFVGLSVILARHRKLDLICRWHFQPMLLRLADLMFIHAIPAQAWSQQGWKFNGLARRNSSE